MTPTNPTPKGSTGGALPNLPAEALYEQGMTHYQRREWKETLKYFSRLLGSVTRTFGILC